MAYRSARHLLLSYNDVAHIFKQRNKQSTMDRYDIIEEIDELQEIIENKMIVIKHYVESRRNSDSELDIGFGDIEIMINNLMDSLDEFSSII